MTAPQLTKVYKKNGRSLNVNNDMLPHLGSLGLTTVDPEKAAADKKAKADAKKADKEKKAADKKAKDEK